MKRAKFAWALILVSTLVLSGCVTRTYNLTRDRVDQDLSETSGNRGYLMGKAPEVGERDTTRTVRVFEIEFGKSKKTVAPCPSTTPLATPMMEEPTMMTEEMTEVMQEDTVTTGFQKYTVEKNDTLQKISKKFYGTTKKWPKIFEANKELLKSPDRVYPGQTLNIPQTDIVETDVIMEQENLK